MRLTQWQAMTIRRGVRRVFGAQASVWLFGSRVDDQCRGGDIDLYIEAPCEPDQILYLEGQLYAFLQRSLGEQRIDILVRSMASSPIPIHEEARRKGVRL
ncbi:MAG: nucleotidyltransferase domain-containing protein [Nitrococcus sp.]|nr:nucleotidyltransferase domain-containing protein [Nitrococcus sp.]